MIFSICAHSGCSSFHCTFRKCFTQMLLEKLNDTAPCLLDSTTIPPEELGMKSSRSGADSGICEGPGASGARHTNGEPNPYSRTFSPHFHNLVELCLQRDPERR